MSGPKTKLTSTPDIQINTEEDKKAKKRETDTRRKRKGKEAENQSETVIRLQSFLLSDLFRILNQESRATKTKHETIIR